MFGNRKLKEECRVLEKEIRRLDCENSDLLVRLRTREISANETDNANLKLQTELSGVKGQYATTLKELATLKLKLRDQNEADLMFVSVKIIAELIQGKKLAAEKKNASAQDMFYTQFDELLRYVFKG